MDLVLLLKLVKDIADPVGKGRQILTAHQLERKAFFTCIVWLHCSIHSIVVIKEKVDIMISIGQPSLSTRIFTLSMLYPIINFLYIIFYFSFHSYWSWLFLNLNPIFLSLFYVSEDDNAQINCLYSLLEALVLLSVFLQYYECKYITNVLCYFHSYMKTG